MSNLSHRNDAELLHNLSFGDRIAYNEIYDKYFRTLYRYARKIIDDEDDAKDIIQEIFISLWDKSAQIKISGSLSSYLYGSVRYKALDFFDKKRVRKKFAASLNMHQNGAIYSADERLIEKELISFIEKAIRDLPQKMRQVFVLSRETDLTHKAIGQQLHISDKTVKKQVVNAVKILKIKLHTFRC